MDMGTWGTSDEGDIRRKNTVIRFILYLLKSNTRLPLKIPILTAFVCIYPKSPLSPPPSPTTTLNIEIIHNLQNTEGGIIYMKINSISTLTLRYSL